MFFLSCKLACWKMLICSFETCLDSKAYCVPRAGICEAGSYSRIWSDSVLLRKVCGTPWKLPPVCSWKLSYYSNDLQRPYGDNAQYTECSVCVCHCHVLCAATGVWPDAHCLRVFFVVNSGGGGIWGPPPSHSIEERWSWSFLRLKYKVSGKLGTPLIVQ